MSIGQWTVGGMTCGGCSTRLRRVLEGADGVKSVEVELAIGRVTVTFDDAVTSRGVIDALILDTGFTIAAA